MTKSNGLSTIKPMRRLRLTITLNQHLVQRVDGIINKETIRNRSHAIEHILSNYFTDNLKKAVILAGGNIGSKALLPLKGKPLLLRTIENLRQNNLKDIIICTGHLESKIKEYFEDGRKFGVHIIYSEEHKPLQTGGALLKIKSQLKNQTFLVIHGDIVTNFSFTDLLDFRRTQQTIGSVALTTVDEPSSYGQLKLHGARLVSFYQNTTRPKIKSQIKSHLINCGIYVFTPEIFDYFPKDKEAFLLEDVIVKLINEQKVSGFVFEGQWFDVGSVQNYEKAIKEFRYQDQI